jgi:glucose-6-phosphate dehydrogenase assembly protein OpcA
MGHHVQRHVDIGLVQDFVADVRLQRAKRERMQQHRDVELLFGQLGQDFVALLFVGRVDVEVLRLTAEFLDVAANLGHVLQARLAVEVHADDVVPRLRERARGALAESTRGAKDQGPLGGP